MKTFIQSMDFKNMCVSLLKVCMLLFMLLAYKKGNSQFTSYTYGGAGFQNPSSGVYRMTDDNGAFQVSAVWYNTPLNALNSFDLYFNVYLGCQDEPGADGMGLVFSPSMGIGDGGANMGAYLNGGSTSPMMPNEIVLVEFDTWDNGASYGDIPNDHIAISRYVNNFCCPPTSPVDMGNMEDDVLHTVRVRYTAPANEWDWDAGLLEVFYYPVGSLCPASPVITQGVNIRSITNSTTVYWGWTAATGGNKNEQWFSYNGTSTPPLFTTACTPLPVELLSFDIRRGEGAYEAIISWEALSTDQDSRIELYRSTDADHWQLVHVSDVHLNYTYKEKVSDFLPQSGVYYYRLEMVDIDEIRTYSDVISVSFMQHQSSGKSMHKVFINSGKQKITIQTSGSTDWEDCRVFIIDITGKEILSDVRFISITEHIAEITLQEYLPEGIYLIKLLPGNAATIPDIKQVY